MRVFVSGLLNIETTVKVKDFPIEYYPIDYPFFGIRSAVSGVGYNLARAFQKLGDRVDLVSFVGNDMEGNIIMETLQRDKINRENVLRTQGCTPVSVVLYDETGRRQIYCDLKDIQDRTIREEKVAQTDACDLYVLCNINFNRELIKKAHRSGKLVATDVHVLDDIEDGYNRDFMENADILFLSDERLPCSPADFARKLRETYRNRVIVIGCGAKGAVLCDEDGRIFLFDAVSCEHVVNTVGAGDALFSGFLHFYGKGYGAYDALIRAEIFASMKIGFNGASDGFADETEVERAVKTKCPAIKEA